MHRTRSGRGGRGGMKVHGLEPGQLLFHRPAVLRHDGWVATVPHFIGQVGHVLLHYLKYMRRELYMCRHRPLDCEFHV